jgi:hypothetical protein
VLSGSLRGLHCRDRDRFRSRLRPRRLPVCGPHLQSRGEAGPGATPWPVFGRARVEGVRLTRGGAPAVSLRNHNICGGYIELTEQVFPDPDRHRHNTRLGHFDLLCPDATAGSRHAPFVRLRKL